MAGRWLSITVELLGGRDAMLWPYPGRIFAVGRSDTFAQLAEAIDAAFARWDASPPSLFTLADGRTITDLETNVMATVPPGEQFRYVFDLEHQWTHRCTVAEGLINPQPGVVLDSPLALQGWGDIPDQHGRGRADDDGSSEPPRRPKQPHPMLDPAWPHAEATLTPVSTTELRMAVSREDPNAVAAALEKRDRSMVLQQAGAAVLAVYHRNPDRLTSVASTLHDQLIERDFTGDAELAELLLAASRSGPMPERMLPVDLDYLADVLEGDPVMGEGGYLDLTTGEVIHASITDEAMVGEDAAVDVEEDPERWLYVHNEGSREGWRDMAAYIETVPDARLQDRLWRSIEGRGAFRRFRDLIHDEESPEQWYDFSNDRRFGRAREWLAEEGIHAGPHEGTLRAVSARDE